ncbi:hypothetical protein VTK73DRAFT_986 [Phialemonium thermophilum]|uniref:N-acetyltransferase domain-containing protein n=1 Tax=Phialemonium thermophilum TaxID=223376 RepID=A0ABR3XBV1_9PEZI
MVPYPDELKYSFRTERLVLRALEDTEVDRNFVFEFMNDPVTVAIGSPFLLQPVSSGDFGSFKEFAKSTHMLSVACLPPFIKDENGQDTDKRVPPRDVTTLQARDLSPIGIVTIMGKSDDPRHRRASLGIGLLERFTGRGYGGEMIDWALDWAFQWKNMHRISLLVFGNNVNALKLYRKMGFVEEGTDREGMIYNNEWIDMIRFSMLEQEWQKLRGLRKSEKS